ncbi:MAG: 50S ribosomal protein L10 [bacterium]|nr:50S ribosomal protein L10 [bacterium]
MKTKAQKNEALKQAGVLLKDSKALLFVDFGKVSAEDTRKLRSEIKKAGGKLVVLKKRLANLLLKQNNIAYDVRETKASVGTVFSTADIESVTGPIYRFFSNLGEDKEAKAINSKKLLGGYDAVRKMVVNAEGMRALGLLPTREVALAQLLGMLVAPVRGFMYILQQKAEKSEK